MILGVTDTGTSVRVDMLDRIAVPSDMANWGMPSPWPIALGIASAITAWPVARVIGDLAIVKIMLAPSLAMITWLTALMIRRAWCEYRPYLPLRWLTAARATLSDEMIDNALKRLSDTPPRDLDRVLRRGEMIEAILDERRACSDARKAAAGVRLGDAVPRS